PLMGEIVSKLCDEAWVTSDNPRSEKPEDIISEILDGIPLDFPHHVIVDRKEAIASVLREARKDDCIVIAGKGHETYQEIKGVKYHFDDREVVTELFFKMREDKSDAKK
ncbi:MAG: UDP-N-acetylmuramoyl-L-alanyl-D-glutamate--2,6-diaminopimelate ligase, partial [Chitinispirillaceae bacterium]|nr:UDP-N-acetylmuramoyl-L-alanyl-D-glutamate--2,6-diaminopimelate ligase [Chitinispirillaceae bacterium]